MIPRFRMNHYQGKVFGEDWRFFDVETDAISRGRSLQGIVDYIRCSLIILLKLTVIDKAKSVFGNFAGANHMLLINNLLTKLIDLVEEETLEVPRFLFSTRTFFEHFRNRQIVLRDLSEQPLDFTDVLQFGLDHMVEHVVVQVGPDASNQ
ncbi:hypothetical protein BDR22DRAFT_488280 [Usnea florida]